MHYARLRQLSCDRKARHARTSHRLANLPGTPHTLQEEGKDCSETRARTMHWYALKVYYNRTAPLAAALAAQGVEHFAPTDVISSLLFIRCDEQFITTFAADHWQQVWLYRRTDDRSPAPIPDREMEIFRFVVTAGRQGLELLGDDRPEYHEGDRVVVTGGPFRGAEGHIRRIRRDRRLVVAIRGVVAVATTYIHPSLLKKADE